MNDVDRRVNREGEPPRGVREIVPAGRKRRAAKRKLPDLTPEQAERMTRSFLEALAAQRQRRAPERKAK